MWQKAGANHSRLLYRDAQDYIRLLNRTKFVGHNDWRLPTIVELFSIMKESPQPDGNYIDPVFDTRRLKYWNADSVAKSQWIYYTGWYE